MWQFCKAVGDNHFLIRSYIFLNAARLITRFQLGLNFLNFLFHLFERACTSVSRFPLFLLWSWWQIQLFYWLRFIWVTYQRELGFWLHESMSHPDCTEIHMYIRCPPTSGTTKWFVRLQLSLQLWREGGVEIGNWSCCISHRVWQWLTVCMHSNTVGKWVRYWLVSLVIVW